jgi:hypothetical protein
MRITSLSVMLLLATTSIPVTRLAVAQVAIGGIGGSVAAGSAFRGVANLPYSATVKTTVVQKLADGTTITRINTTKEARDSEGRNMRQMSIERPNGEPAIVNTSVVDPVNHTMTSWMNASKLANVVHLPEPKVVSSPALPSRTITSDGGVGSIGSGAGQSQSANTPQAQASRPKRQREQLGGKTIAGVYAEGTRITTTIPEDAEGNDRPFTIVSETWRSPELNINLLSVNDDPRTGKRTTEVTDLDRAEPDPSVFQVPEGYTVKDQSTGQPQ